MLLQMAKFHSFLWLIFHCIYTPHLLNYSSVDKPLGCFHFLATVEQSSNLIHTQQLELRQQGLYHSENKFTYFWQKVNLETTFLRRVKSLISNGSMNTYWSEALSTLDPLSGLSKHALNTSFVPGCSMGTSIFKDANETNDLLQEAARAL